MNEFLKEKQENTNSWRKQIKHLKMWNGIKATKKINKKYWGNTGNEKFGTSSRNNMAAFSNKIQDMWKRISGSEAIVRRVGNIC